jgi:hypothetical protein
MMRTNNHATPRKRNQLPVELTKAEEPVSVLVNEGSTVNRASTENQSGLMRVFELIIEAAALAQLFNEEVAHFTMLAALVTGERLGIPDKVANRMRDDALNEAMRTKFWKSSQPAEDRTKRR